MLSPFLTCLTEELTKRGYGDKRQAEIVDRFNGLREAFVAKGVADPDTTAMAQVLSETELATREKQRRAYDTLLKRTQIANHFTVFAGGKNPSAAAVALLSADARSKSGLNVDVLADVYKGQLWAAMNDVVEKMGKGKFGFQKGKAFMDDVVDEIFGKATGSGPAKEIADAWNKGAAMVVDLWNGVGGTMHKMDRWGLPQLQSLAKVIRAGGKEGESWVADHMNWLDWDRMRWPNGAPIDPADREGILKEVWKTLSSDGMNKIDPDKFRGNGHALGNMVDEHRFLIFKDGDAWRQMHSKYGDGSVYDVMTSYIDSMSHKMGLLRVFGNNPEQMMQVVKGMALQRAQAEGAKAGAEAAAYLKNRFDPLAEHTLRKNAMDPESTSANIIMGTGNLLNAAQLAGAVLAAIPGDFATTMVTRAMNKLPVLEGLVGQYAKNLVSPTEMVKLSTQSGFVLDEVVHSIYAKSRFSGVAEYGPAWTKRVADFTMRASMMNLHTNAIRWTNQAEMMGALARNVGTDFDNLPFKDMMSKYGITAKDWDAMRAVPLWEPYPGVERLRPSDTLASGTSAAQNTYERFQSMILQESRYMVPNSTAEASVTLKGNLRPDTLPGALLHSFAMYKNFPITLALMYGRAAMSVPSMSGRLTYTAALGTSLLLAGAVGIQLREMSKGRDPLPMDGPAFWGKAALASGAMSIWGDFLFSGINRIGQGPTEAAAGPIVGFAGDTAQLAFGKMFKFADEVGTLKADKNDKSQPWAAGLVEYASRYTPGSSIWWGRAALQRELFDPLRALADPRGATKMDRQERKRVKDFGNQSWWEPNTRLPQRPPGPPIGVP